MVYIYVTVYRIEQLLWHLLEPRKASKHDKYYVLNLSRILIECQTPRRISERLAKVNIFLHYFKHLFTTNNCYWLSMMLLSKQKQLYSQMEAVCVVKIAKMMQFLFPLKKFKITCLEESVLMFSEE